MKLHEWQSGSQNVQGDLALTSGPSVYNQEMGRRLWTLLVAADVMASSSRGIPCAIAHNSKFALPNPAIVADQSSAATMTELPANVDDANLSSTNRVTRPDSIITDVSYIIVKYHLACYRARFATMMKQTSGHLAQADISQLDKGLRSVLATFEGRHLAYREVARLTRRNKSIHFWLTSCLILRCKPVSEA